jgi:vanillate/3-O-methylgallate O-demethylase
MVKFDHDFIGRAALENLSAERRRQKVVLVWDHDDVQRVYASQFGDGPLYKSIEVRDASGALVGVSCHAGYVNPDGKMLSLAMLDGAHAVPGSEALITWGEPDGGSRKPQVEQHEQAIIRATVAPAPFTPVVRERFRESVGGW